MRFYKYGFNPFIAPGVFSQENNFKNEEKSRTSLIYRTGERDRKVLDSFWIKPDGVMSETRLVPVESFDDKDILIKNQ